MPSQPNPDSPYMASRVQSVLGVRAPGTPSAAGKPDVQAGRVSFPAPPAPASAPVGRPSNPVAPAPAPPVSTAPTPATLAPAPGMTPVQPVASPVTATPPDVTAQPPLVQPPPLGLPRPDGSIALTPEGDMRYRQAVVAGRSALGPVPRVFTHASLPELPYELGQRNWNPFTSTWSDPMSTKASTDGMS